MKTCVEYYLFSINRMHLNFRIVNFKVTFPKDVGKLNFWGKIMHMHVNSFVSCNLNILYYYNQKLFFSLRILVSALPYGRTSYGRYGTYHQRRGKNSPPKTSERLSILRRFYMDNKWVSRGYKWRSSKFGIETKLIDQWWLMFSYFVLVLLFWFIFCYVCYSRYVV